MENLLANVRVASPCHENWNEMTGDDRSRHCAQCDQHVYNLSAMTEDEAIALLESRGQQRTCIRMHRRLDGTVITRDCPVGKRKARQRNLIRGVAATAIALAGAACNQSDAAATVAPTLPGEGSAPPVEQIEPHELVMGDMCIEEPAVLVEPAQPVIMGKICIVPPPQELTEPAPQTEKP